MDIDSTLPQSDTSAYPVSVAPTDPYVADLISVADKRIEGLDRELRKLRDMKEANERTIKSLRKQVSTAPIQIYY